MGYSGEDFIRIFTDKEVDAIHLHDEEAPLVELERCLVHVEGPPLQKGEPEEMLETIGTPGMREEARRSKASECLCRRFGATLRVMAFLEQGSVRVEVRRLKFDPDAAAEAINLRTAS